jgi:hypothetical protein
MIDHAKHPVSLNHSDALYLNRRDIDTLFVWLSTTLQNVRRHRHFLIIQIDAVQYLGKRIGLSLIRLVF